MSDLAVEWVELADRCILIASSEGQVWAQDIDSCDDSNPFSFPMAGIGSPKTSAGLLHGAIVLGLGGRDPDLLRRSASTLAQYVLDLVGSYHNSKRTAGHYLKAAERFRTLDRIDLATYLERHAREETAHDRLALRDLNALGLPGERLVANLMPDGVEALCALFDELSFSDYPVGCIGYSYFFESSAAKRSKADIDTMQALGPAGVDVTRFMRAHSSMGSEADHVDDMIDFIASLPASDRIEIVRAAYATADTALNGRKSATPLSEAEMWEQIQAAVGLATPVPA